jgi:hypothetical protein
MILLVIADHATDEGDNAWPSQLTIATRASCNVRTVQRSINELVAKGYLWVEKRGGGSANCRDDRRPHRYTIVLKKLRDDKTPPRKTERGDNSDINGATITTATGRLSRPMKHPNETPLDTPGEFEIFWKVYPRKTAKGAARKAWDKLTAGDQLAAIEGAKRFAADPNREDTYTPYPATWLNAEQWGDEPLPPRKLTPEAIREAEAAKAKERAKAEREAAQRLAELEEEARAKAVPMPEYLKELLKRV